MHLPFRFFFYCLKIIFIGMAQSSMSVFGVFESLHSMRLMTEFAIFTGVT